MSNQNPPANTLLQAGPNNKNRQFPSFMVPIFKLPIILYKLRLGWLLGKRFMQLTHIGRRSGKVRKTILAVLCFDETTKEIFAVSAWKGSDWFYNIQSSPAREVEIGDIRYAPEQRSLSPEEIATAINEYRQKHPIFSRIICRIPGWKWDSTYEEFLGLAHTLRGVVFRPK